MRIKPNTKKVFTIKVNEKELDYIQLAVALMLQGEYTHPNWHKKLGPLHSQMLSALGRDGDWRD